MATASRSSSKPAAASAPSARPTTPSAKPKAKPKTSSAAGTPASSPRTEAPKRRRIDWEAVERDYRTGQLSNVELAAKHGTNPSTLSRKIKDDQALDQDRWQKDLTEVVRQATNARLMAELVKESQDPSQAAVREGQEKVKTAIQVAAEVNANVIRQHQRDAGTTRALVMDMLAELTLATHKAPEIARLAEIVSEGQSADPTDIDEARRAVSDMLDIHKRVASIQKLADTLHKLQPLERRAHGIKDDEGDKPPRSSLAIEFVDAGPTDD
ncbi:MAG: hypothetical protein RL227_260 [Pseudomonadota bacterium]|jgi:hypothetical protein